MTTSTAPNLLQQGCFPLTFLTAFDPSLGTWAFYRIKLIFFSEAILVKLFDILIPKGGEWSHKERDDANLSPEPCFSHCCWQTSKVAAVFKFIGFFSLPYSSPVNVSGSPKAIWVALGFTPGPVTVRGIGTACGWSYCVCT